MNLSLFLETKKYSKRGYVGYVQYKNKFQESNATGGIFSFKKINGIDWRDGIRVIEFVDLSFWKRVVS